MMETIIVKMGHYLLVISLFFASLFSTTVHTAPIKNTTHDDAPKVTIEFAGQASTTSEVTMTPTKNKGAIKEFVNKVVVDTYDATQRTAQRFSYLSAKPCSTPIKYRLGTFDTRFQISKADFLKSIANASGLWASAYGKNLFEYDDKAELTINLVYDERQNTTQEIANLHAEVQNIKNTAETLKSIYDLEQEAFSKKSDVYNRDLATYTSEYEAYTKEVEMWNKKGGAPPLEYNTLTKTESTLKSKAEGLALARQELLDAMKIINTHIDKYNEYIIEANRRIDKSNGIGKQNFTEGKYDPNNATISIYQFTDDTKLFRVVAHELGHVLTLDHNDNPDSIMYATNNSSITTLSKEDISALQVACSQ